MCLMCFPAQFYIGIWITESDEGTDGAIVKSVTSCLELPY